MNKTPDYTQADMDRLIKAAMLRVQAKAMREHANSLSSHAIRRSTYPNSDEISVHYTFASKRAHDEADCLEEQAKELENERENAALRQAANAARSFIEAEYGDPSAQPEGEWLAREARAIHRKLCDAICGKDFEVS